MNILTTLKRLINVFYLVFIIIACLSMVAPFYGATGASFIQVTKEVLSMHGTDMYISTGFEYWVNLFWNVFHLGMFFMILFYLRKFVIQSVVGESFDKSTRKYLNLAGTIAFVYGSIRLISNILSPFFFESMNVELYAMILSLDFLGFGSPFFISLIGLVFIYLSQVLELSDIINEESRLTI